MAYGANQKRKGKSLDDHFHIALQESGLGVESSFICKRHGLELELFVVRGWGLLFDLEVHFFVARALDAGHHERDILPVWGCEQYLDRGSISNILDDSLERFALDLFAKGNQVFLALQRFRAQLERLHDHE